MARAPSARRCRKSHTCCAFHALTRHPETRTLAPHASTTTQREGCVLRRHYAVAFTTMGMLLALGPAAALSADGRSDVILAGSQGQVDYHAEAAAARPAAGGATIIGGNIQIKSDRGLDKGVAGVCDPDPRFAPAHPRPDDQKGCSWATPGGPGED